MFDILGAGHKHCDRIHRREMLRLGGLAPLGLSLPALLAAQASAAPAGAVDTSAPRKGSFGRAKRCLMLYMWGGPAHQDTLDMKPEAPEGIRGEFKPIATPVPGLQVCEHLPYFAKHADKIALIRSVTHGDNNHSTAAHWMLTGRKHRLSAENFGASADDFPHLGSVISKQAPVASSLPTFVALPERIATTAGAITPGQDGGILGKRYDPFRIDQHPDEPNFEVPSLRLPEGTNPVRVAARKQLLESFDRARPYLDARGETARGELGAMQSYYQQALDLVSSPNARRAFDLASEDPRTRDLYGRHTFGQSVLLARRLLEAGVKLVTVYWHRDKPGVDTTWDTHSGNFKQLKERLLPQVDRSLAALFEDLSVRGLLDDTLVVWTSEFGRTPKVNASNGGRDHWGPCNSIWLAGAGIPGGQIYGASDKEAAWPATQPVYPADLTATYYHLLGISPETIIHDQQNRPLVVSEGRVLEKLL